MFFQRKHVPIEVNRGILKGSALNDGNEAWPCLLMTLAPPPCPGKQKQESWSREILLIGPAYESQVIVRIGDMSHLSFKPSNVCRQTMLTATLTEPERDELRHFLGDAFS